jgi:hypothetical protein
MHALTLAWCHVDKFPFETEHKNMARYESDWCVQFDYSVGLAAVPFQKGTTSVRILYLRVNLQTLSPQLCRLYPL